MATIKKIAGARRAESISLEALSKSVDAAVLRATKALGAPSTAPTLSMKWEIVGRRVSGLSAGDAFDLAESITSSIKVPGLVAQPAISRIGKDILVGFINRSNLPLSIGKLR